MAHEDRRPPTRQLTIIAQDPSIRVRNKIVTAQVEIPSEYLRKGPAGYRTQVIDYDASTDTFYQPAPVSSEDPYADVHPNSLVDDPHFHAQNVYAIVMATLGRFERALGRRVRWGFWGGSHQIKITPHGFADANAYYSRDDESLVFGYFPGARGTVYTCLSHDIVAHEATHALIDGIRRNYLQPSSPDQSAFHEGFSDVVALLSVFKLPGVVAAVLTPDQNDSDDGHPIHRDELTVTKLRDTALLKLAEKMGSELKGVRGEALRHSAKLSRSPHHLTKRLEPHTRGEILVAAILNTFLEVWFQRLFPNGRRGVVSVDRDHVVKEGAKAADHLLTMAIRALDYTPPVDLQFGDYLSAILTADVEVHPDDTEYHYRDKLRSTFAAYGIKPTVTGQRSEPGIWDSPSRSSRYDRTRFEAMTRDPEEMFRFIWENRDSLKLEPDAYTRVESVRPTTRINTDGFVVNETVAEYVQILDIRAEELAGYGLRKPKKMKEDQRVVLYGGAALIFDDYGRLKFNIGSGVRSNKQNKRLQYLFERGYYDERGTFRADIAEWHRIRGGGPSLHDPYAERSE